MISNALTKKVRIGTNVMEVSAGMKRYTPTAIARERKKSIQYEDVDFFAILKLCTNIETVINLTKSLLPFVHRSSRIFGGKARSVSRMDALCIIYTVTP